MPLSYLAHSYTTRGERTGMDHKQLRAVLIDHFSRFIAAHKAKIDASGPLSEDDRQLLENTVGIAELELEWGPINETDTDRNAIEFIERYKLDITQDSPQFALLKRSISQANRDYAKSVLAYSDEAELYDLGPVRPNFAEPAASRARSRSLDWLVSEFWKYAKIENRWTGKTEGEKQEHIDLLYERLGRDMTVADVTHEQAHLMRETLVVYPVNRHKLASTRGRPLLEVLKLENVRTLHALTINKYLQTYNSLFNWAVQNGHCQTNPFAGLALNAKKANRQAPRLPFEVEQLDKIKAVVLSKREPKEEHHRWGTLIGIYSGARLNEVAQLHLDDVVQVEGTWCFDINDRQGTRKKLKNRASARKVPVHPKLIEAGFLAYFDRMKEQRGNDRLFPQFTYTKSDGYGRNLGRWFNESLLPSLELKTAQLTFHSLRHTMINRLIAAEVSQPHIMAIVGHEQGTTTLDTYNRKGFPPAQLLAALEKVT